MSEISIIDQLSAPYAKRKLVKTMMIGFVNGELSRDDNNKVKGRDTSG